MICKECEKEFNPSHPMHKGKNKGICGYCEDKEDDVPTAIGVLVVDGKSRYEFEILHAANEEQRSLVAKMGNAYTTNLARSSGIKNREFEAKLQARQGK